MLDFLRGKFSPSEARVQEPNLEYLHSLAAYKDYDVLVLEPGQQVGHTIEKPTIVYAKDKKTYTVAVPLPDGNLETRNTITSEEAIMIIDEIIETSKRLAA